MKVGFTGTREGLTELQRQSLRKWLRDNRPTEVHHGMCVGGDAEFSCAVVDVTLDDETPPHEVAHPCTLRNLQWTDCWADEIRPELPPLERNRNIVDAVDVLLVGPKGPEELRSGTWSTCRYARTQQKRRVVFWPDGKVEEEGV